MLLLLVLTNMAAQSFKLSGGLRELLTEDATVIRRAANQQSHISLLMKVTDAQQMAQVCADYDMEMVTDLGHIAVVAVPIDQIEKAAADSRVLRMEKEGGFHYCIEEARKTANVDPVTSGQSPLTQAYTGNGVIVGIIDGGMQYNHPNFLKANGETRIRKVWDFNDKDGQPEAVVVDNSADILARKYSYSSCNGLNTTNHGSHVAGIAAGSGRHRGIAYESDIIYSDLALNPFADNFYELYSDFLVSSVKRMSDYADEQQHPLVINMSLGNNLAFSTESKLMQEAFSLLTGPGRIIIAANGNEGDENETKSYFNSGSNQTVDMTLKCEQLPASTDILWKTAGSLSVNLEIKSGETTKNANITISPTASTTITFNHDTYTIKYMRLEDAPDGKHVYKIRFSPTNGPIQLDIAARVNCEQPVEAFSKFLSIISVSPTSCTLSNAYTACVPAVFPNVIAVGNYCNRYLPNVFEDEVGKMNSSSSWGPTWDGRNKPDVSAPGSIISSGNFYTPRNAEEVLESYDITGSDAKETWVGQSGTSQAAPVVAGIVALWLQAKPNLTPADIISVINKTSKAIETIPNNHSGAGIIDAYKGLCEILELPTAIPTLSKSQPAAVTFRLVGQTLYADGAADGIPVTIYDLSGAVLQQSTVQQGSISLIGLQRGVYAVQLGTLGSTIIRY